MPETKSQSVDRFQTLVGLIKAIVWGEVGDDVDLGADAPIVSAPAPGTVVPTIRKFFAALFSSNFNTDVRGYGAVGDGVTDDSAAFLAAIAAHGTAKVRNPGVYILKQTLFLTSGQGIVGAPGVILRRGQDYGPIIANTAATTHGAAATWDDGITIANLSLSNGAYNGVVDVPALNERGTIQLTYAKNVRIRNVTFDCPTGPTYLIQLAPAANVQMQGVYGVGNSSGIQVNGGSHDVTIDGFDLDVYDDTFALNAHDWAGAGDGHDEGDIYNFTIMNGRTNSSSPGTGNLLRLLTGSWLAWANGNTYRKGHVAKNASKLYQCFTAGPTVASVAPTHTYGDVTGADGIRWRWVGNGTHTTANIFNVEVRNVFAADNRLIRRSVTDDADDHSEYPGTENTSYVDNINVQNVYGASGAAYQPFSHDSGFTKKAGAIFRMALRVYGQSQLGSTIADTALTGGAISYPAANLGGVIRIDDSSNSTGAGGMLLLGADVAQDGTTRAQFGIKSELTNAAGNGIGDLTFSGRTATGNTSLAELCRLTSTGRIGLGTASPTGMIEAKAAAPSLILNSTGSVADASFLIERNGTGKWAFGTSVGSGNENLNFYNYTTSSLAISVDQATNAVTLGGKLNAGGAVVLAPFLVLTVPSAAASEGGNIYISNESGGKVPAFSDGANWRRVTDRAVIS